MTELLPDPRCFAPPGDDPFVALAVLDAAGASQRDGASHKLVQTYRDALSRGDDHAIASSLRQATSAAVLRRMWTALDRAVHAPPEAPDALVLRLFALPLLLVTGGRAGAAIAGVLPDVTQVQEIMASGGALGPARNFGFGNALCAIDALEALSWSRLHALQRDPASAGIAGLHLPPAAATTATADEEVHLRFLVGAGVTRADAPSFAETGAAIGRWGMPLTHELVEQLRVEGLSVLPIPRPPATLLAAQSAGFAVREDLALQAFVSRTLRRLRSEVGEPDVTIAALGSGTLGVRFSSPFIENRVSVHRRALHGTEDVNETGATVVALLRECGIAEVAQLPGVVHDDEFAAHPAAGRH